MFPLMEYWSKAERRAEIDKASTGVPRMCDADTGFSTGGPDGRGRRAEGSEICLRYTNAGRRGGKMPG